MSSLERTWQRPCPADPHGSSSYKHRVLTQENKADCPDCGALNPYHTPRAEGPVVIDLTESPEVAPKAAPESPPPRSTPPVFRVPAGIRATATDAGSEDPVRPPQSRRPRQRESPIEPDVKVDGDDFPEIPRSGPISSAPVFTMPRALEGPPPLSRPQDPVRPQPSVRPQQRDRPPEAVMGRTMVQRARTGAFQERTQREQPPHHGGHPRTTEIPNALAKTVTAKAKKKEEQERIDSDGLFINVTVYEYRYKQVNVRGNLYLREQMNKEKLVGDGMDIGSVYFKWDTQIPDMHEFILKHILAQTVQWKQNPRVHTRIHSLALGVKSTGKGNQQLVGASLGWEEAKTINQLLACFPDVMQSRSIIVAINRTIIEEDLDTSLTEDENENYRPFRKDTLRTPKKPFSQGEPEASSSEIKSEPKIKTPRKQASKGVSTPTTKKTSTRTSATTLQQQETQAPSASPLPNVDELLGLPPMSPPTPPPQPRRTLPSPQQPIVSPPRIVPVTPTPQPHRVSTPPPQPDRSQTSPQRPTVSPITPPGVQTRAQRRRKATSEPRESA